MQLKNGNAPQLSNSVYPHAAICISHRFSSHSSSHRQRTILILGAGTMQMPVIFEAKLLSLHTIVVDGNDSAPCKAYSDEFWHIDLKNPEDILEHIYTTKVKINAVITCATDFSYGVAYLAEQLGLAGITPQSAMIANYKHLMRDCLQAHNINIPRYMVLSQDQYQHLKYEEFLAQIYQQMHDYFEPQNAIIVKPVDNMGARGVRYISTEMRMAYMRHGIDAIREALRFSKSGKLIAEEFLEGEELSIDSFMQDGRLYPLGIADRHIHCKPYFIETAHSIPSSLSLDMQTEALRELEQAALAAGIQNGICKGDIIFHKGQAYIGEFAARLSGGYMSGWTLPYSYGNYAGMTATRIALQISLGNKILVDSDHPITHFFKMHPIIQKHQVQKHEEKPTQKNFSSHYCKELALYSLPGILEEIQLHEGLYEDSAFRNIFINKTIGTLSQFPKNNAEKLGSLIVASPNQALTEEKASELLCNIVCKVVSNREASDFLYAKNVENCLDHSSDKASIWRNYTFHPIEEQDREKIFPILEQSSLFDQIHTQAIPVYISHEDIHKNMYNEMNRCA